ncbi:hypothetical protein KBI31_02345 [Patescibacteria group bacterium]|jgi:hypothetical protein|nr:hypothetical protein [Patescibacteria group bacterium]HPD07978.1 hypothetical protein [bacterium]HRT11323.1 hypothetical protein [Patescibacteria group bacterium]HRU90089.1 hypothetical protein [Patescibacteria group bacterium]
MAQLLNKKITLRKSTTKSNSRTLAGQTTFQQRWLEFIINYYYIFIALICIFIMVGSVLFFFLPQYRLTLSELNANNQRAQIELVEKQKYQAKLVQLNDFYKSIDQNTRNKVMDILPVQLDKENLLAEIEAICLANNLLIKSSDVVVEPSSADNNTSESASSSTSTNTDLSGHLRSAIINLELSGRDYINFKKLLKTIENNLHLMDIEKLEYLPGKNQIILNIKIYYLAD